MNLRNTALAIAVNLFMVTTAVAAPEFVVDQDSYGFGTVYQGQKVQHSFGIKNTGDAPLQIRQLKASCGCTAATPSSPVIAPGKSGEIKVTFDSTNFSGRVQKTVDVVTNAGKNGTRSLLMDGFVIEEVQLSPKTVNAGAIKVGTSKTVPVTVGNAGSNTVKILSATSTSPQIKAKIVKREIKSGEGGTIEVTITPQTEARVLSGYVHITTDNPRKKELTLPVYASPTK